MFFSSKDEPFVPHSFSTRTSFLPGKEPRTPKIFMSHDAYVRQWLYVDIASQEVGWMGIARRLDSGDFVIDRVMLFEQDVHSTETEIDTEGLSALAMELLANGEKGIEDWNNLRFWGHSHVRMGTSPSGTDENTMVRASGYRGRSRRNQETELFCFQDSSHPWAIRGIFNKDGRAEFTIFLYEEGLKVIDAEWTVLDPPEGTEKTTRPTSNEGKAELVPLNLAEDAEPDAESAAEAALLSEYMVDPEDAQNQAKAKEAAASQSAVSDVKEKEPKRYLPVAPAKTAEPDTYATGYTPRWGRRTRDKRYNPDIPAELRAEVLEEFRAKVRGGWSWLSSSYSEVEKEVQIPDTSSAAALVSTDPVGPTEIEGEASGPGMGGGTTGSSGGTTGYGRSTPSFRDRADSRDTTSGGTGSNSGSPYRYTPPPAPSAQPDWRVCTCSKCFARREAVAKEEARRRAATKDDRPGFWASIKALFRGDV